MRNFRYWRKMTWAIVLSGADSGQIDAVLGLAARGVFVGGQSLEGCYDAVAVTLLAAGGVDNIRRHFSRDVARGAVKKLIALAGSHGISRAA